MRKWPEAPVPFCGESNRHTVGKLRGYLATLRACYQRVRAAGDWHGSPRARSLALIGDYQANVSAGRDLCPHGDGGNCSELGRRAVARYGFWRGWATIALLVVTCGLRYSGADDCNPCTAASDSLGRGGGGSC